MRISTIAFANLRRRKGKAAFLAGGIALGIGTAVALFSLSGSIRREIGTQLDQFGANIVVAPRSNSLSLDYGGVAASSVTFDAHELTGADLRAVSDIPHSNRLSAVAPKLLGTVRAGDRDVVLAGVDFGSELRVKRWWRVGGQVPAGPGEALVGRTAAEALGLVPAAAGTTAPATRPSSPPAAATSGGHEGHNGHEGHGGHEGHAATPPPPPPPPKDGSLRVNGRDLRVTGVLAATGGADDRMVFVTLPEAQSVLGRTDRLSLIEVSALCKDCPIEDIVGQIEAAVPHAKVSAVQQAVRAREQTVEQLGRFSAVVSAVVLAIGGLLIFTAVTGSVVERTREIGVLRAIGFRKSHIVRGLAIEVAAVSAAGGVLGWAAGTAAGWAALPYFADAERLFQPQPHLALLAVGGALAIGLLGSAYPILRAARLDPADAVRVV